MPNVARLPSLELYFDARYLPDEAKLVTQYKGRTGKLQQKMCREFLAPGNARQIADKRQCVIDGVIASQGVARGATQRFPARREKSRRKSSTGRLGCCPGSGWSTRCCSRLSAPTSPAPKVRGRALRSRGAAETGRHPDRRCSPVSQTRVRCLPEKSARRARRPA